MQILCHKSKFDVWVGDLAFFFWTVRLGYLKRFLG